MGEKNSPKITAVLDWLSKRKGALGDFAKKMKPVLGKVVSIFLSLETLLDLVLILFKV